MDRALALHETKPRRQAVHQRRRPRQGHAKREGHIAARRAEPDALGNARQDRRTARRQHLDQHPRSRTQPRPPPPPGPLRNRRPVRRSPPQRRSLHHLPPPPQMARQQQRKNQPPSTTACPDAAVTDHPRQRLLRIGPPHPQPVVMPVQHGVAPPRSPTRPVPIGIAQPPPPPSCETPWLPPHPPSQRHRLADVDPPAGGGF